MAITRTKYETLINNGSFLGITPPEYEHFKIELIETTKIGKKGLEEVSRENNFQLKIVSSIAQAYKEKLDELLKIAFKLNWAPYDYREKAYNYYTKYIAEDEKKDRLTAIFQTLKDFEVYYKDAVKESIKVFNEDALDKKSYDDHEVVVKYNEEKKCFVVLAIRFLGAGKYPLLANAAFKKGTISTTNYKESGFFDEFVDWEKYKKKDLYFFEINPESYLEIRNLIEIKKKEKEIYIEEQEKFLEETNINDLANFEEENIFDLKIKYNEEQKMFEFFCKGYFEPERFGYSKSPRSFLSRLAVNYILSKELSDEEFHDNFGSMYGFQEQEKKELKNDFVRDDDLDLSGQRFKYNLKFLEQSTKREKKLFLPLSYNNVLKEIIQNFENNRHLFGKKIKEIKIKNHNPIMAETYLNKSYPTIYLNDDGKCYFILATRETSEVLPGQVLKSEVNEHGELVPLKVSKGKSASFSMKALEITHKEALFYFFEHAWANKIEENSIYLNSELWMTNENKPQLNQEDRKKSFDILLLHNKIQSEANKTEAKKVKKLKI